MSESPKLLARPRLQITQNAMLMIAGGKFARQKQIIASEVAHAFANEIYRVAGRATDLVELAEALAPYADIEIVDGLYPRHPQPLREAAEQIKEAEERSFGGAAQIIATALHEGTKDR